MNYFLNTILLINIISIFIKWIFKLTILQVAFISDSQSAFIKGRQILDGILVANEIVDEARKQRKELHLFKVGFEKAYDSVDCGISGWGDA